MSQKVVLNREPKTFAKLKQPDVVWLRKNGYESLADYLEKNDLEVPRKLRKHEGLIDLAESQPNTSERVSEYTVVEIPDGVDWHIEASGGKEKIVEKSRTWP